MSDPHQNRRNWLKTAGLLGVGCVVGRYLPRPALTPVHARPVHGPLPPAQTRRISAAFSMAELQRRAQAARAEGKRLPDELRTLGGINFILGFTVRGSEIILLGARDPQAPQMHIDDLMVALRSAWQAGPRYREPPGCTIDPRTGDSDPWAIQDVKVLGQPDCRMARRHVALDYELKRTGAGLMRLAGVRSSFDSNGDESALCGEHHEGGKSVTSRYWFCTKYPDEKIRYSAGPNGLQIDHPVGVQVQTELMMQNGKRGSGTDPEAELFALEVSELIASGTRWEYCEIVNDFRLIELGALLRHEGAPRASLEYMLQEHEPEPVAIPRYVAGIKRTETNEVVCHGEVTASDREIRASLPVSSQSLSYRGGVEALVEIATAQFKGPSSNFEQTVARLLAARPNVDTLAWEIETS